MKLYIHSSGRYTIREHKTLSSLVGSKPLLAASRLVVQHAQYDAYAEVAEHFGIERLCLPKKIQQLSPTRQWLLENALGPFAMCDDDLLFSHRRTDDPTLLTRIGGHDVYTMFNELFFRMRKGGYIHGGILAREGANRIPDKKNVFNIRMMRVLAYNPAEVRKLGARFDRVQFKQDFDMTLQLLRAGQPNLVMADYAQGQYGSGCSNAPGGCSAYRTDALRDHAAHKLAELHPDFVKLVEKTTKRSWGGGTRTEVNIQWKQAYASAS